MLIQQRNKLFDLKTSKNLKLVYVWGKGMSLFTNRDFKNGEMVINFRADIVPCHKASFEAVRINDKHCYDTKWLTPEAFINHSCEPNTRLDVKEHSYVAIKNIKTNTEITFNYLATEWDFVDHAFKCRCNSKNCYGKIRGLKYLTKKQQTKLKPTLLPFLLKKLDTTDRK